MDKTLNKKRALLSTEPYWHPDIRLPASSDSWNCKDSLNSSSCVISFL